MKRWLFAFLPLALGGIVSVILIASGESRNLSVSFPLRTVFLLLGGIITALCATVVLAVHVLERRAEHHVAQGRREQREAHATFLRRLDHELKNPVMGIRAALANVQLPTDADGAGAVRSIHAASDRLTRLVTDLRKLGEISEADLEIAAVDVTELAREAVDVVRETGEADARTITTSFPRAPRPLPLVPADQDLLFLAIVNVVTNAVKYSAAGDTIEIRGLEEPDAVVLEIADTGAGIHAEDLPHVFDELARGRATMHIPGTGLGLPFVRAIIERHGGTVALQSREGEGTRVRLRLVTRGEDAPRGPLSLRG